MFLKFRNSIRSGQFQTALHWTVFGAGVTLLLLTLSTTLLTAF